MAGYYESEQLLLRALDVLERSGNVINDPTIAHSYEWLARNYFEINKYSDAEQLLEKARKIREKTASGESVELALNTYYYAELSALKKDFSGADAYYLSAINQLMNKSATQPLIKAIHIRYANRLATAGQPEKVKEIVEKIIQAHSQSILEAQELLVKTEEQVSAKNPLLVVYLTRLAWAYIEKNDYGNQNLEIDEALKLLNRALQIMEDAYGKGSEQAVNSRAYLVEMLSLALYKEKSINGPQYSKIHSLLTEVLKSAISMHVKAYGKDDPRLLEYYLIAIMNGVDIESSQVKKVDEDETFYFNSFKRALSLCDFNYKPDNLGTISYLMTASFWSYAMADGTDDDDKEKLFFKQAIDYSVRGLRIGQKFWGEESPANLYPMTWLASLYLDTENYPEADRLWKQMVKIYKNNRLQTYGFSPGRIFIDDKYFSWLDKNGRHEESLSALIFQTEVKLAYYKMHPQGDVSDRSILVPIQKDVMGLGDDEVIKCAEAYTELACISLKNQKNNRGRNTLSTSAYHLRRSIHC